MFPSSLTAALALLRQDELLREAEHYWKSDQYRDSRRLRHRIGDTLIRAGRRLNGERPVRSLSLGRVSQAPTGNAPLDRTT
jgi:hypothetical protein